jgi:predicted amidohydrolase
MRVAVCQMRSGTDTDANLGLAERLLHEAADGGADLAMLPEYASYLGPSEGVATRAELLPGGWWSDRLATVAAERQMWVLGGTLFEAFDDDVFDTAPLFARDGDLAARYRKVHLFDAELPGQSPYRESSTFAAGHELVTHQTDSSRVGLSVCYDLRFPELYRALMVLGAEIMLVPAQFQAVTGEAHWHVLIRARAIENQCFVAAAAQWGAFGRADAGRRSFGHSMIVDPWGRVLVEAPGEGDGVWFADLDLSELRRVRTSLPALSHRRLGLVC